MSETPIMLIFTFLNLSSLCFLPCISFTLKPTHRDSPQFPLYDPNLSDFQRFTVNIDLSKSRASIFEKQSQTTLNVTKNPRNGSFILPLTLHQPLFTVELSLSTPLVKQTLVFDTGSGLTWTQCEPCIRCFKQSEPLFDLRRSKSYKMLNRRDDTAKSFTCNRDRCVYHVRYYSGQKSVGLASSDNFYFHTSKGDYRKSLRLVFGCGVLNKGPFGQMNAVSGILGLDKQPVSFARQLDSLIQGRFSYCFPELNSTKKQSYLRFGDDAFINKTGAQNTQFFKTNQNDTFYRLILTDISINRQKLGLKRDTFPEGCVIDSGASISLLNKEAYKALEISLDQYFSRFMGVRRFSRKSAPKGLVCYTQPRFFKKFPNMTLHFNGADYWVPAESLFLFEERYFCMAMMWSESVTILGAYQQQNVRVLYDLKEEKFLFARDDCSKDATAA